MRRTAVPLLVLLLLTLLMLALFVGGCGSLRQYPSLGTYYVDADSLIMIAAEDPDTLATLVFGDTLEVIDAPFEVRASDDMFVVHRGGRYGRIERDFVMSELLFLSKYTRGRPVYADPNGRRYYRDEFGDTIRISWHEDAPRPARIKPDTVVVEKPKKKRRKPRR